MAIRGHLGNARGAVGRRTGDRETADRRVVAEALRDRPVHLRVVLAALLCEAEESEEDERAEDDEPAVEIERECVPLAETPHNGGDLLDAVEAPVRVSETLPRRDHGLDSVQPDREARERDGKEGVHHRKCHETEVARHRDLGVAGEELVHLAAALEESPNGKRAVDHGDGAKKQRPHPDQRVRWRGVERDREAADLLEDVEAMSLDEVVCDRLSV